MRRQQTLSMVGLGLLAASAVSAQLGPTGTQFFSQDSPGVSVGIEAGAHFGTALAAGDYDCDGFEDLAIGMPLDDLTGATDGGRLIVFFGGPDGITTTGSVVWGQNSPVIQGTAEFGDRFSEVMVSGNFDGDSCDDLAIGVPFDNPSGVNNAGAVNVLYGSPTGLTGDDDQYLFQTAAVYGSSAETGDFFGSALAVGDFNDDGIDDLAIGAPFEDWSLGGGVTVENVGVTHVVFGSLGGLCITALCEDFDLAPLLLRRDDLLQGSLQTDEHLGSALAAGNFTLDLLSPGDELAIGVPGNDSVAEQAGLVILVSQLSLNVFDTEWSQDTPGISGQPEFADRFGSVLAAGNFRGFDNGLDQLAVGVPEEDFNGSPVIGDVGVVHIFDFAFGDHQNWRQDDVAVETIETNDSFGGALAVGDFDANGIDDLAIGAPGEDLGAVTDAGLVHVLHGVFDSGLTVEGAQLWFQTISGPDMGDQFGFSLASGNFTGIGGDDLAIGAPFESIGAFDETGAITLLYSESLFSDGFESGDVTAWIP